VKSWAVAALDLLYPALCPVCSTPLGAGRRDPLCAACWDAIPRIDPPFCDACGVPFTALAPFTTVTPRAHGTAGLCGPCRTEPPVWDYARAAARYEGPLRDALHAFKFEKRRALARPLADLVLEQCGADLAAAVDALVPVPLGRARACPCRPWAGDGQAEFRPGQRRRQRIDRPLLHPPLSSR